MKAPCLLSRLSDPSVPSAGLTPTIPSTLAVYLAFLNLLLLVTDTFLCFFLSVLARLE